jgi:hypothetical protein
MKKIYSIQCILCVLLIVPPSLVNSYASGVPDPVSVKDFGARGDGVTDDTKAIIAAVNRASDGVVEFPRGSYRITRTIEIVLSETGTLGLSGKGGSARIIMEGEGPAFLFKGSHNGTAGPESVKENTWNQERMPFVDGLEIVGKNPKSDGLEFRHTLMPVIRGLLIRDVHHGIHLFSRNRNVIIDHCHVYNCTGVGIYFDSVNLHQTIISDSHISYCKLGGIGIDRSEIRDIQITGNDIEYNCDPEGPVSADVWFDCSVRGSVREGTISGNTIQAIPSPGGANIRFKGSLKNDQQIGLISITGNHISNHTVNIQLERAKGISITGNTFIRGYDRHMIIDNCSNIIINANVFDHNTDYFPKSLTAPGGITVSKSKNIIFTDNILDGVNYGSGDAGGALMLRDCSDISVRGCQVINPEFRGVEVVNCSNLKISDCLVNEQESFTRMLAGIEITGSCPGTIIKNNSIGRGKKGDILNRSSGAVISDNITVGKSR